MREFLTAEWLHSLLVDEGSRAKIENLFFRRQYGIDVIVPTMRPILPWLSILDQRILARVVRIAPEILFEGGDPSQLRDETRANILRQSCEQLAQPAHGRSVTEYSAVQRFANPDLAEVIRELLDRHKDDDDIVWFLLRMVYQGGIAALADKAKHFALISRAKYTRMAAIRAVIEVGSQQDATEVRQAVLTEGGPIRRSWLSELVAGLGEGPNDIDWLLTALEFAAPKKEYETDPIGEALASYVSSLSPAMLGRLLPGLGKLLRRKPVVERHHCEISKRYNWLAHAAGLALMELIEKRDIAALTKSALSIMRQLPVAENYGRGLFEEVRKGLPEMIRAWPELNRALFWNCIADERSRRERTKGDRLTDYWHASMFGAYWGFDGSTFDAVCEDKADRKLEDDRLVALSLAFALYQQNGRPRAWRERLKKIAATNAALDAELTKFLNPPTGAHAKFKRQRAAWKRRSEQQEAKEEEALEESKRLLASRVATIRDPGTPGLVTGDQHYLHEQMRSHHSQNNWRSDGNWKSLVPTFGEDVALAFRDATVSFWRHYTPTLRSEGAPANSTPFATIFGLTGLAIESRETEDLPSALNSAEAELATRYALQELNGFPAWLPQLNKAFPAEFTKIFMQEILHELKTETVEGQSHYALYDASWHGDWLWDQIANALRVNTRNLGYQGTDPARSATDPLPGACLPPLRKLPRQQCARNAAALGSVGRRRASS